MYWHSASLLLNGMVLIAGGGIPDGPYASYSSGLYVPDTGIFASTGFMTAPRISHTATLLRDGTVLMAGGGSVTFVNQNCGYSGTELPPLGSAELYSPSAGAFTSAGNMTTGRYGHTATLLPNGTVLITGGTADYSSASVSSAELYVPSVLVPAQVVTALRFDRTSVVAGSSYSVNVSGSNLTPANIFRCSLHQLREVHAPMSS